MTYHAPNPYDDGPSDIRETFGVPCEGTATETCSRCQGAGFDPDNDPELLALERAFHELSLGDTYFIKQREEIRARLTDCKLCYGEGVVEELCGEPVLEGEACGYCGTERVETETPPYRGIFA